MGYRCGKRAIDVVAAAVALVLTAPVLGVAAVAVALTSRGPVLFRQERAGRDGRPFVIFKLRTMRLPAADGKELPEASARDDQERTTRVGQVLRATSIDELPQLINVLLGEMSLVGPRPTLLAQVAGYTPHQRRRLTVRPGITGLAQVSGRNLISWEDRIELDVEYVRLRSLLFDTKIMVRTVPALLTMRGIYGSGGVNPGFGSPPGGPARATARRAGR